MADGSALTRTGAEFAGTVKAQFPFWDSYHRPFLLDAIDLLPARHFDFKPRPEMFTAQQVILHIAETERWWVHHVIEGEKYENFVVAAEDRAQGWVNAYDAPDHNALRFALEEYHRHTQRLFGLPVQELERIVNFRHADGQVEPFSVHWILAHVEEHELHHRAQLNLYLRLLGITPPAL